MGSHFEHSDSRMETGDSKTEPHREHAAADLLSGFECPIKRNYGDIYGYSRRIICLSSY